MESYVFNQNAILSNITRIKRIIEPGISSRNEIRSLIVFVLYLVYQTGSRITKNFLGSSVSGGTGDPGYSN